MSVIDTAFEKLDIDEANSDSEDEGDTPYKTDPILEPKVSVNNFFFCRTHSHVLFWGHWYPCFGFLVTSHVGFKARVGSALFALWRQM